MRMANKSALFEVYVHAFSITHATIQLPIYPADPPLLTTGSTDCLRTSMHQTTARMSDA